MEHVFISYSRKDTEFIDLLVEELRYKAHSVWLDTNDIRGGTDWAQEIEKAINDSYAILVIVSANSKKSEWVGKEIKLAQAGKKKRKIPIIPLKIDREALPRTLARNQIIDFSSMFEGNDVDTIRKYRKAVRQLQAALELARPMLRFLKELKSTDPEIREVAASKLGELNDYGAAIPLINALKDLDSDVRYEAAIALEKLKVLNAYKPLARLLTEDENPDVCAAAASALGELGLVEAIGPLELQIKNPDRFIRASVVRALGNLGDVSAVNILVDLLRKDGISDVRDAAKEALANIGGRQAERALRRMAQSKLLGRKEKKEA